MLLKSSRLQRRAFEPECRRAALRWCRATPGPRSAPTVGAKRKVGCMGSGVQAAGLPTCRQHSKARRKCRDGGRAMRQLPRGRARAEVAGTRGAGVGDASAPATVSAAAAVGGSATLEPPLSRPAPAAGSQRPPPEPEPEMGGGDGGPGNRAPPGGDDGGGGGWRDDFFDWWENNNPFSIIVTGVKMRAAADPEFIFKICVECGLDATIIITVNLLARREKFFSEMEFVFSQIAVSLLNDFALVYLLAPTPECSPRAGPGTFRAMLAEMPSHVLQRSPPGMQRTYSLGSRALCFAAKAVQYGTVGLIMGTTGSAFVLCLTSLRQAIDGNYKPPPTYQPCLGTGLGWGIFMSGSSNVRYNLINFLEEFAQDRFPGPKAKALSIVLRFSNNVAGAHLWMDLARKMNLNRPRKERGRRGRKEAEKEPITAMPVAH